MVDIRKSARSILEESWRPDEEFCPPNSQVYPHQWLWDSCFHAIAWSALGDERGQNELRSSFRAQLPTGFVPHMRYLEPNDLRGPLSDRSSFTQPPIYAHAAHVLSRAGFAVATDLLDTIAEGLDWLWQHRLDDRGLLFIVHPWESGADDSPRWDSWVGRPHYNHRAYSTYDAELVAATQFDDVGAAVWSRAFVAIPAAFNAFAAHAAHALTTLTGDAQWDKRGRDLATAMDHHLWDDEQGLWLDLAVVGGGDSVRAPTLDGVFGALATANRDHAQRVLDQLLDPRRFASSYGLRYLPPDHTAYDPNEYWRGPAWPQLNYMAYVAAQRWARPDVADAIRSMSLRAATESRFSEYWNPETGAGLGACPQGWAALAAAM